METKAWNFVDKSAWGSGPWLHEPDKLQWQDEASGLPCILRRADLTGAWCGYVGVPRGHPCYGLEYGAHDVEVHGGLTYSDYCDPDADETGICHTPAAGESHDVWWLGFDCGHAFDLSPALRAALREIAPHLAPWRGETYRDLDYAKAEVLRLAAQLRKLQP